MFHVPCPDHLELFPVFCVSTLDDKFGRKNISQFSTIPISPTNNLLLVVVVVATGEQMTKDQLRNIYFFFLVHGNGNALSIVVDGYEPLLLVDLNLEEVHFVVSLVVVCCVDEDLVEDFIEGGNEGDLSILELK